MAPLDCEHDNEAVQLEDEDDDDDTSDNSAIFISAITKVTSYSCISSLRSHAPLVQLRKIIRNVRSSPQCRQKWCKEIYIAMNQGDGNDEDQSPVLMLILDVRTRWSSTHQMLCETHVFDHCDINSSPMVRPCTRLPTSY